MVVDRPKIELRPLRAGDVAEVIDLVRRDEFAENHSAETLRALFDYRWAGAADDRGLVLTAGGRVVGCLVILPSTRRVAGETTQIANTSTWYVVPEFRGHSLLLLVAAMKAKDVTLTTLSSSPDVGRVLEKLGYARVGDHRLLYPISPRLLPALRSGARIVQGADAVFPLLDPDHQRILDDHRPYPCRHYAIVAPAGTAYVVTKLRWVKGHYFLPASLPGRFTRRYYRVSELLYVSDPTLALAHWDALRARVFLHDRTVGMIVQDAYLGGVEPPGARKVPRQVHAYRRGGVPGRIDALYSEFVVLPL